MTSQHSMAKVKKNQWRKISVTWDSHFNDKAVEASYAVFQQLLFTTYIHHKNSENTCVNQVLFRGNVFEEFTTAIECLQRSRNTDIDLEIESAIIIYQLLYHIQMEKKLMQSLESFEPLGNINVSEARILLIGQIGAGKSSVVNTMNSVYRGRITAHANIGCTEHSLTTTFRVYQVVNRTEKALNLRICDTQGIEEDQGIEADELSFILDGNVPDKYNFNPLLPPSSSDPGWQTNPTSADKIHCVAIVVDGSAIDVISDKVLDKLKKLQLCIAKKGIPQVVLLTKIDKICKEVSENVSCVFESEAIRVCVEKVSSMLGLPRSHILPFKNYESEVEVDMNVNILALLSLKEMIDFANDSMYKFHEKFKSQNSYNQLIESLKDMVKVGILVVFCYIIMKIFSYIFF